MSTMRRGLSLALLMALAAAPACGGGGGGDGGTDPVEQTRVADSDPSLDGWVYSDGQWGTALFPIAGDVDFEHPNVGSGAYYSFDLGGLGAAAQVLEATLLVYQTGVAGDPYGKLGSLRAEYAPYGNSLGNADTLVVFNPPAPASLTVGCATECWMQADVRGLLARALSEGETRLQLRVGFVDLSSNDGVTDFVGFSDGASASNQPTLTLRWQDP